MGSRLKKRLKKILKKGVKKYYCACIRLFQVKKDMILFESNLGRNYTGNPKYIYEEMVKLGLDEKYKCYFIFEDISISIPGKAKKVRRNRFLYFYLMARAGVWVSDSRMPMFLIKREGVHYIQTWHGTPLKKLALDMDDVSMAGETTIDTYKKNFYKNTRTWDYLISQNNFSTHVFRRAFAFDKTMLEIGYPRNDTLINNNHPSYIAQLKKELKLPADKKIILYAPTWRDNEFYGKGKYKFNPKLDFKKAKIELEDEYIMIVKYHYLIMDSIDWSGYEGFIYDCDLSYDIADLYLVSDYLITDYSSVMFDYSLLHRPMFFYAYDLDNYKDNLRGFYFDFIEEVPGPISLTTDELIRDIKQYDANKFIEKYDAFSQKYNHVDDGQASSKVVNLIVNLVEGRTIS